MSKTFPCCIANAAGCACSCGQTDADVLSRELKAANKRADRLAGLLRDRTRLSAKACGDVWVQGKNVAINLGHRPTDCIIGRNLAAAVANDERIDAALAERSGPTDDAASKPGVDGSADATLLGADHQSERRP